MRTLARSPNDGIVQYAASAPFVAFAVALALIGWLRRSRWARHALDHPNRRSLHQSPIPRIGGLGVLAGVLGTWALVQPELPLPLWIALALLAAISFADDVRGVPVYARFAAHLIASGLVATDLLYGELGAVPTLVMVFALAWMINLYNFMDGSDGLAGGMTLFGFSFYGVAAWLAGSASDALFCFGIAGAAAAFLCFNFNPARVFLGDAGAVPLGFLAGALGIVGYERGYWPGWFPLLVFSPFIVDATVTLARRAWRKERFWEAHFDHHYQRLIRMGWGHRRTALWEYALMLACGLAGVAALAADTQTQLLLLGAVALVYAGLARAVDHAWRRFEMLRTS